ncbi:MAG: glycoside hydrolase family 9 protein [Candidatus Marinimicrobia bacterium]|nr:glycoside hydrolase family 9 protein [Candidatus Neomarinimicrobiota bacterium]
MKKLALITLIVLCNSVFAQIAVNQVGYLSQSQKPVYFLNGDESFSLVEKTTGKEVYSGKIYEIKQSDPATGQTIYEGDFTPFQQAGEYIIQTPKNGRSASFFIRQNVYDNLYQESLKTFYIQRCGLELTSEFAGDFVHPACHTKDAEYHRDVQKSGLREVSGGWHDAGDYGRYIVNGAYSVAVMLLAYEIFPEGFQSDTIGIPESKNRIPDLLDEIRYEMEWMLKMQDEDGGLFHKVTEPAFQSLDLKPHEDKKTQVLMIKTTAATADFTIAAAQAARIFKKFDKPFANQCKAAALRAWYYLEMHTENIPQGGFQNPEDIRTGTYGDENDADERFWAAVEMYRTFKDKSFEDSITAAADKITLFPNEISWCNVAPFGVVSYVKLAPNRSNPQLKQHLSKEWQNFCEMMLTRYQTNGYGVLLNSGDYRWGSLQIDLNFGFILLAGGYEFTNDPYRKAAVHQIHFILGANGLNLSFVTGFGEKYPVNVHNRICSLTHDGSIYPGFLVGGPNENLQDPLLQELYNEKTPPAFCYVDSRDSYASNETCINWNAILVAYAGYLNRPHQ